MLANLEREEFNSMTTAQVFRALFQTDDAVTPRVFEPARSLQRAEDTSRTAQMRTMDLGEMSRSTELLFRQHLSPLSVVGEVQHTSPAWPIALARWTEYLHRRATALLLRDILPGLRRHGFEILPVSELTDASAAWIHAYFQQQLYPLLTPLAVDSGRPFPYISSDSLNLLVELKGGAGPEPAILFARVKIPSIAPRLVRVPTQRNSAEHETRERPMATYVWSVDLVRHYVAELFVDIPIRSVHCFRVLRAPAELSASRKVRSGGRSVRGRDARGPVVRVDVESGMRAGSFDWLVDHLDVISYSVVRYDVPDAAMSLPQLASSVREWSRGD